MILDKGILSNRQFSFHSHGDGFNLSYGHILDRQNERFAMKVTNLELSREEMFRMGEATLRQIIEHIENLPDASCNDLDRFPQIAGLLSEPPPEKGVDFEPVLDFLMNIAIPASMTHPHPSFMGYIPAGGLFPSAVADFIAAATNRYIGVSFAAPALARLERAVLDWFVEWMEYPSSARGILTSGGSHRNSEKTFARG
jgi:aromatic-L-amino-acid decarboxylase